MVEEEPDLFAFRHALTREAIGGRLLGRERRRLHEKALAALQETGAGDWAAIAWHAQGAGRYEEMVEAARTDKALAMAEAVGCPAVRAAALVNKGTALADRVDGHDEGVALLERAVAEAEAGGFGYVLHRALYNLLVQQVTSGRRSAAAGSSSGCGRQASGPAAGPRPPAGPCTAARSPSSRATWRRPWPPHATPAAPTWSRSRAGSIPAGST
jgi:hypothetical protein